MLEQEILGKRSQVVEPQVSEDRLMACLFISLTGTQMNIDDMSTYPEYFIVYIFTYFSVFPCQFTKLTVHSSFDNVECSL